MTKLFLKKRFLPKESVFSIETAPEYIFNMASNTPWQRMFRADFIREHGIRFQNLRHANDTYFSLMATYYAKRITYTEKPLVNYRINNSESVTGKTSDAPLCAYEAYAAVFDEITKLGISEKAMQSFYSKLLSGLLRELMTQTDGDAMNAVYSKIKEEGVSRFGFDLHTDAGYYYFKNDFEDLNFLLNHTLDEFLMYKYKKERETRLFYKNKAERTVLIRLARRAARLLPANSSLYDKGKRFLRFK